MPLCDLIDSTIREEEINWSVSEIIGEENSWNIQIIQTPLNSSTSNAILGILVLRLGRGVDKLIWGNS